MDTETSTITRRELLKKGALVGAAVLWVTPVVQVVGMGRAHAKDVSPNCTRFCLKWEVDDNVETGELTCPDGGTAYRVWTNNWVNLDDGEGNALTCPGDGVNDETVLTITSRIGREFVVYGSRRDGFWIAFPNDIKVADLKDESEPWSAAVKCGQGDATFTKSQLEPKSGTDPCLTDPNGEPYRRILITGCDNANDISHIELIIDWCP